MYPPKSPFDRSRKNSRLYSRSSAILLTLSAMTGLVCVPLVGQSYPSPAAERAELHSSLQWAAVEHQLPDRLTSTPAVLETEGDILRARRLPEDAMDYYNFAFQNGGKAEVLLNKLGLTALDLNDTSWAREYFERVVRVNRRSADGWDNLGTIEYLEGRMAYAVENYSRAVKLDPNRADFHCNLAAAYIEEQDYYTARKEMAAALRVDPLAFERVGEGNGAATEVFSAEGRGRLSFEIARLYARNGSEKEMLHALAMSSEAGFDVQRGMRRDAALSRYAGDPQVQVLIRNAQALRAARASGQSVSSFSVPLPLTDARPLDWAGPD